MAVEDRRTTWTICLCVVESLGKWLQDGASCGGVAKAWADEKDSSMVKANCVLLRFRLLAIGLMVSSYGWKMVGLSLERTQNITNAE